MSNLVYPSLPGMMFGYTRSPNWKTEVKTTASGREFRGAYMSVPTYAYSLTYEFLRNTQGFTEFQNLLGFYNQMRGCFDTFLFQDPDDYQVTGQVIAVGDGVTKIFQLVRTLGGSVEPVYEANYAVSFFYINGTAQPSAVGGAKGLVTMPYVPNVGDVISWTGQYYWRCRFTQDHNEFSKMMVGIWESKKVEFITVLP